jgi:hypothetical protein
MLAVLPRLSTIPGTEQGSQFTSTAFTGLLLENGIEARRLIGRYLDFFNTKRPHSSPWCTHARHAYFAELPGALIGLLISWMGKIDPGSNVALLVRGIPCSKS